MMKSSSGNNIKYTLFGMSHSEEIGIEISGIKKGFKIDENKIKTLLMQRQGMEVFNTKRQESIDYIIKSGIVESVTTGEVITIVFKNENYQPKDYSNMENHPRPGHGDYVGKMKYGKEFTGGGHFSGRMTAPIVFLGGLCQQLINELYPKYEVVSRISKFQELENSSYYDIRKALVESIGEYNKETMEKLRSDVHHTLKVEDCFEAKVKQEATKLVEAKTTAGGEIETVIINPPSFVGNPFFASVESVVSSLLFSIPSVKGVNFGYGTSYVKKQGHLVSDEIIYCDDSNLYTLYNYNGGVNGGITNGEDIVVNTILKPISSIMREQLTYNLSEKKRLPLKINGRHDTTIINRVIPVIDSMINIALYDLIVNKKEIN